MRERVSYATSLCQLYTFRAICSRTICSLFVPILQMCLLNRTIGADMFSWLLLSKLNGNYRKNGMNAMICSEGHFLEQV